MKEEAVEPVFDLKRMEWVYAVWFVAFRRHDILILLYKQDGNVLGKGRLRHKGPTSPVGDKKLVWSFGNHDNDPVRMLDGCRDVVKQFVDQHKEEPPRFNEELPVNGTGDDAIRVMSGRPWWHPYPYDTEPFNRRN